MSKTIAINAGSSSLKWQLYLMPEEKVLAKGLIERIGLKDSISTVKFDGRTEKQVLDITDHTQAVKILLDDLMRFNIIASFDEITGVGHRVVAGGEYFKDSALVDEEVIQKVEELSLLAPLHNPANAAGIRAFKELLPDITSVVVFDTSFHTTMPEKAYRYPLPTKYYKENKVRKYGAHGTSHEYVAHEAAKLLGKPLEELKLITCHIGNGASITAVDKGVSVDTSMGFTPLGGVMMGTRTGDIDPAIIPYLMQHTDDFKTPEDISRILNRESGLLGVSEKSSDMRDIHEAMRAGDAKAQLANDIFVDRIQKYIGQYLAVLNGADAIIFTAGIGENSVTIRKLVIEGISWFGCDIDPEKNVYGQYGNISTPEAKVRVLVIPTDEELVIARDVERFKK
ncbi:Acetate kinase [Streptococcus gordonii]|jgi:acetate kinase|uniref:Acetate kinase n=1 Tax=Streptococcus gordonii (strain Challis / ATCC 35105 / BCRC 15272 / CH1 / DL1 / V288) TaxID=467705 RepID=ACKA_STRGC|nr:acetate kinase [Streptococcus gordonii]A8AZH2.1 RecName: Full=Acetate kinase; AltName: Full=Acetokinase [Streptococcus gordonii str. Challis substr. CH1]ABV10009.1 acetate kinase [Streptococcus gordonii str. Challis substr. CH1]MBZ2137867.1 acetate kinase [Streptococcus gordonii]QGS44205.1 acetate/propionate family kinase [Streptococcus gordonii]RSJ56949.1 Acetate kinase [Streptococcus gordonii]RSK10280.1 Acetate kinase [Streptococcus gordonii]